MKTTIPYRKFLLLLIIISTAIACSEEEMPKGPVVLTGTEVVYHSGGGPQFFGKINHFGSLDITEYGFSIWWVGRVLNRTRVYIPMGEQPDDEVFSLYLGNGFPVNISNPWVRAYFKIGEDIYLGNSVTFFKPNTMIRHSINEFFPAMGVPGDTITISGIYFGWFPGTNKVFFNNTESTVVSESLKELKAIVPEGLPAGNYTISVSVIDENVSFNEYLFQLTNEELD